MAIILAAAAGNWNATGTWTGGVVPVAGDIVIANNRIITVNVNATCQEVRNDSSLGGTAGGRFDLTNGVTLFASVYCGSNSANVGCVNFSGTTGQTATIDAGSGGVIRSGTPAANANPTVTMSGTGTLNVIAGTITAVFNSSNSPAITNSSSGTVYITGNITGHTGTSSPGVNNSSSGTIFITGDVNGGVGSPGVLNSGAGSVTISGGTVRSVLGNATGVTNSGIGTLIISSNVVGGSTGGSSHGVFNSSTGSVSISGTVTGGVAGVGVQNNGPSPSVITISGAVIGGVLPGASNTSTGTFTITNTCTGGTTGVGALNSGLGAMTIATSIGGTGAAGSQNSTTGTLTVTRAIGNGFGPGSTGVTSQVGVNSVAAGSITYVSEFEFGALGQAPTAGPIRLTDSTGNVAIFRKSGGSTKTLIDATTVSAALPSASDVRAGTVYNAGNTTGTMAVPVASSVQSGVAVGATTGTAMLTPAEVWNYLTSNSLISGSFGERLANAATVATTGQQVADVKSS